MDHHEWAKKHGQIFGLDKPTDMAMLFGWADLFQTEGYSPAELDSASLWIAGHAPPKFRSEHLSALLERLRTQRTARRPSDADDRGECVYCGNSGWVVVPAEGTKTVGGNYCADPLATSAVVCSCQDGRRIHEQNLDLKPQTIEVYEHRYPRWKERLKEIAAIRKKRIKAMAGATSQDLFLGLIPRMRQPSEDDEE